MSSTRRIPPAGDPFTAKSPDPDRGRRDLLARLEDRLAHELILDDEERQELRDRILRLRRKLARQRFSTP